MSSAGRHNDGLTQSTARILTGATWKKQRVAVLLPAGGSIPTNVVIALRNLQTPTNQPCHWVACVGDEVGLAYERMIDSLLGHPELRDWEYVLTVEHDNTPPPDGLIRLIERMEAHPEYAAISGLYWTKGESGVPQIWGDANDPVMNFRPQPPQPGKLVECVGIGMGFVLYRMAMFRALAEKKVARPWFKTINGKCTQDLYFWGQVARPAGYRCAVDCSVLVGHHDASTGITW